MKGCISCLTRTIVTLILLVVIAVIAASMFLLPQLDRTLEDSIRREFILPPSSTVIVSRGSMLDTLEGQVERMVVESPEAKLDGLVVNDFELLAEGIRIDLLRTALSQQAEFIELTHGAISFTVTPEALKDRWTADLERRGFSEIEIELGDKVTIEAKFDLRVTKIDVLVSGWIEAADDNRVKFVADNIEIAGANVGFDQIKTSVSSLAPIVDLGRLKLDLTLQELQIVNGRLLVRASSRSLDDKLDEQRKLKTKLELEQTTEAADDEDLVEQIRGLLDLNEKERGDQLNTIMGQLKQRGVDTKEKLSDFMGKQAVSLQDEYQSVLRDLNRLIESQIKEEPDDGVATSSDSGDLTEADGSAEAQE